MTDDSKPTDEFHGPTLSELIERLGPPPDDVVEAWRQKSLVALPSDVRDWDLDALTLSPSAVLVARATNVVATTPLVAPQANAPAAAATKRQSTRPIGRWIVASGLLLGLVAALAWAFRPQDEPIAVASSDSIVTTPVVPRPQPESTSARRAATLPTTEPLVTLDSLDESTAENESPVSELMSSSSTELGVDPQTLALESLLPSLPLESTAGDDHDANSPSADPTTTMDDVLASGDDSPPPESPQATREVAIADQGDSSSSEVSTDPLAITFGQSDQQPTWDLGRVIATNSTTLTVALTLAEDVQQGWVEPLDDVPVKRARGIVVITPTDEESVAIGIRIDARTSSKLSLRIRVAARLDPSLPWQSFTRQSLLNSIDYLGQQSLHASARAEQIDAFYNKSDTSQRRVIRDQRDAAKTQSEHYKMLLKRCGELLTLVDKIEANGKLSIRLVQRGPDGAAAILETVATP